MRTAAHQLQHDPGEAAGPPGLPDLHARAAELAEFAARCTALLDSLDRGDGGSCPAVERLAQEAALLNLRAGKLAAAGRAAAAAVTAAADRQYAWEAVTERFVELGRAMERQARVPRQRRDAAVPGWRVQELPLRLVEG